MRTVDLIHRKRDGEELSAEEIAYVVDGYTNGTIPDYQASAFLMAVFFSGMTDREVSALTERMTQSGERVDLSSIPGLKVDKQLRVIGANRRPIRNLYAAGEVLGFGRTSGNAFVGGLSLTPALAFGKVLGERLLEW